MNTDLTYSLGALSPESQAALERVHAADAATRETFYRECQQFWLQRAADWQRKGSSKNVTLCRQRADKWRALIAALRA